MALYSRKLRLSFDQVITKLLAVLDQKDFSIVTTIDVQHAFRTNLNINFRNYRIITVCNPQVAYKVISLESHTGALLPCNIVVQEHENGEVEVSCSNFLENIDQFFSTTQLRSLADETGAQVRNVIDGLHAFTEPGEDEEISAPEKRTINVAELIHG